MRYEDRLELKFLMTFVICFFLGILGIAGFAHAQDTISQPEIGNPVVVLETSQGNIELELFPDVAPKACASFLGLVQKGYYNGIIFHRVIKGFMIQAGDPTGTGRGGESFWGGTFDDEFDPKVNFNKPGVLAMANRGPNTNGSQFFITTAPTPQLNMHYTIFGKVLNNYQAVQAIESAPTGPGDRPTEEQAIIKAYVKDGQ